MAFATSGSRRGARAPRVRRAGGPWRHGCTSAPRATRLPAAVPDVARGPGRAEDRAGGWTLDGAVEGGPGDGGGGALARRDAGHAARAPGPARRGSRTTSASCSKPGRSRAGASSRRVIVSVLERDEDEILDRLARLAERRRMIALEDTEDWWSDRSEPLRLRPRRPPGAALRRTRGAYQPQAARRGGTRARAADRRRRPAASPCPARDRAPLRGGRERVAAARSWTSPARPSPRAPTARPPPRRACRERSGGPRAGRRDAKATGCSRARRSLAPARAASRAGASTAESRRSRSCALADEASRRPTPAATPRSARTRVTRRRWCSRLPGLHEAIAAYKRHWRSPRGRRTRSRELAILMNLAP